MTDSAEPRFLTLNGLADGALEELFQEALAQTVENIEDPNTSHKDARVITMKITFHPDEDRRKAQIEVSCSKKLAGRRGLTVNVYIGKHKGTLRAVESPSQKEMFPSPDPKLTTVTAHV